MAQPSAGPKPLSLRAAQRELTRSRIRDAGREAFFVHGYEQVTVDDIAQAAGASRSTLYVHFRDKDEILAAIVADYTPALIAVVAALPGPVPSRAEIDDWLRDLAAFFVRERTPTVLIVGLAGGADTPPGIHMIGEQLITTFARRLPAFRSAIEDGPRRALAHAWATVVIREVGWACRASSAPLLTVAGDLLERFVRDHTPEDTQ